ncbi:ATP-binding protein [Desulfococcaceae bacterium HSG8]|nr:ATP-binding protein [Desulfococcaceae bacterium HSG8]
MDENLLIIEDDAHTLDILITCLTERNCQVKTAKNKKAGLLEITSFHPSVVIVNADMPGGIGLPEEIRTHDPDMLIMVMSRSENMDRVMNELKYQAAEFISKPVNPIALEIALNRTENFLRTRRALKECEESTEKNREKIETERFLTVRQVVDNISLIIAKTAKDVQGGIRYFNEMPYFLSIHSRDGKVLTSNPTYKKYLGNRIHGNSWDIYTGAYATPVACPISKTIRTENVMTTRAVVRYQSGARVPVIVHTAPIFNNDGEVELILEVFAGTKEIDRMSHEIKTTQQRYQQLFDAVPCYVVVLDMKLRVAALNQRCKEDFGDQKGRVFSDVFKLLPPADDGSPIDRTLHDGLPHQSEVMLISPGGEEYKVLVWTSPIKTAAGKLIQILAIFADITELRKLQDNLCSLGLMMGTLSHNLKGSLTGLDAGLYMIDSGFYRDRPGRIEEGLDVAKLMVERVRRLVHDILYYSKEREIRLEEREVLQFASDVSSNIETRIRGANIEFRCDFAHDVGKIEIDPELIRAALNNILENAMEACIEDASGKSHRIEFKAIPDRDAVVFEIRDNGSGMDKNQIRNMFTLFYSSKGHRGTGLGMFIAHNVIRKHGGEISASSEPGKGTHFYIRLPRKVADTRHHNYSDS